MRSIPSGQAQREAERLVQFRTSTLSRRRGGVAKIEVKVPDIGDFKDMPIIEILVKPGDAVRPSSRC